MELSGLTDDLLRKIFFQLLCVRVLEWLVFQAHCGLGMTCKRLRALFPMQDIRQHVMSQLRTIRYDFFRCVATAAAHAASTRPWPQIWLTARLHLQEQWIRVVTTIDESRGELCLHVTTGNTNDLRRQRTRGRIAMWRISWVGLTSIADMDNILAIECLITLQQRFARVINRRRVSYTQEHCLFLL